MDAQEIIISSRCPLQLSLFPRISTTIMCTGLTQQVMLPINYVKLHIPEPYLFKELVLTLAVVLYSYALALISKID